MSLLSEREKMIMAGKATDATRDELLRAAILEIDILPTAKAGGFLDTYGICLR